MTCDYEALERVAIAAKQLQDAIKECGCAINASIGGRVTFETDGILIDDPYGAIAASDRIKGIGAVRVFETKDGGHFSILVPNGF